MPPATTTQPSMCRSMPRVHQNSGMMRAVYCCMVYYGLSSSTPANVHIARHMFMNSKLAFVRFIVSTIDAY
jgi:hypothetical protein